MVKTQQGWVLLCPLELLAEEVMGGAMSASVVGGVALAVVGGVASAVGGVASVSAVGGVASALVGGVASASVVGGAFPTCIPHTDSLKALHFFLSRRPDQSPSTDT
eukprot:g11237.t1